MQNKYQRAARLIAELHEGKDVSFRIYEQIAYILEKERNENSNAIARKYAKDMLTILRNATARRDIISVQEETADAGSVNA